jgi:hypothetical protein
MKDSFSTHGFRAGTWAYLNCERNQIVVNGYSANLPSSSNFPRGISVFINTIVIYDT